MSVAKITAALFVGLLCGLPVTASAQSSPARTSDLLEVEAASSAIEISTGACRTPVRYSVTPGALPEGGSYDVTAKLRDHSGRVVGSDSSWLEEAAVYRGSILPACGKLDSGAYTVEVEVDINDYYLDVVETRTGSTKVRLKVTKPAVTKLVVRKYAYGSRGWQWTGRLSSGGRPLVGQRIDLWWDLPGWEDYEVSKRTNRNGVAHWVSNPDGGIRGIRFRLKFEGSSKFAPSRSSIFDLAPR